MALIPAGVGDVEAPRLDPREELGEVYLHMNQLDLDDHQAVVEFVDRHGVLGIRFQDYEAIRPWLRADPDLEERLKVSVREAESAANDWLGVDVEQRRAMREKVGEGALGDPWWGSGLFREGVTIAAEAESLEEFRVGATCVTECIAHWSRLQEGYDEPAAARLDTTFRAALRPFSPNVAFVQGRVRDERAAAAVVASRFWSQVPLFSALMLELFNHISEGAEYRTCKECSRLFVRQEGRAKYGQHRVRGGAAPVFCSTAHASTFTTRAARARARKKKTATRGSKSK